MTGLRRSPLAKPYPAPTASQVPTPAVNTTVVMKITASIRDKVHALGMRMASVPTQAPLLWISCV
jgi:hypothetical protein